MATTLTVAQGAVRQVDYWWIVYKRTWKGSVVSSFLSPIFYVLAMGVLLGGFIAETPSGWRARRPTWPSSSPAWSRPTRCRRR